MKAPPVALIGGDARSLYLARKLSEWGLPVSRAALCGEDLPWQRAALRAVIVLPTPLTKDGRALFAPDAGEEIALDALLERVCPGARLFGGGWPETLRAAAEQKGCRVHDFLALESVARANAVPTAEGAIALAMDNSPVTIDGSRCVVAGCGRCGRALAVRLRALGAEVTLTARKRRHRLWARLHGMRSLPTARLAEAAAGQDFLFNTVPARVVGDEVLTSLPEASLTVELASRAAGVDLEAAAALGRRAIYAPGLPGKVAPATAADVLCRAVIDILREEYPWIDRE